MSIDTLLGLYVAVLLGAIAAIAIYLGLRQRSFRPTRTEDRIFRCARCDYVYTDDPDVSRSRCPQCGHTNVPCNF